MESRYFCRNVSVFLNFENVDIHEGKCLILDTGLNPSVIDVTNEHSIKYTR
jgi:hypothetical protein